MKAIVCVKQVPDTSGKVLVQYNIGKEQPEYLSKINEAQTFDLTSDNYATVWGESM